MDGSWIGCEGKKTYTNQGQGVGFVLHKSPCSKNIWINMKYEYFLICHVKSILYRSGEFASVSQEMENGQEVISRH